MTESLGAKLADKFKQCKNNSFLNVVSKVKPGSRKSTRSQYFESVNLAPESGSKKKRTNETQNISEMSEASKNVKPNTRSTLRKKGASETENSSRKLSKVMDKHQNISDNGLLCNNKKKFSKKRRNVSAVGGCHDNDDIDIKRKRLDQDLTDSDVVTSESLATKVVKNRKTSMSRKANSTTTKNSKIKANKIKPRTTKSKSTTIIDDDDNENDNSGDEDSEDDDDWEEVKCMLF